VYLIERNQSVNYTRDIKLRQLEVNGTLLRRNITCISEVEEFIIDCKHLTRYQIHLIGTIIFREADYTPGDREDNNFVRDVRTTRQHAYSCVRYISKL